MADQVIESVVSYEGKHAKELFFTPVISLELWNRQGVKIIDDIQSRLKIYFSGKLDKVTKKRDGCGNTYSGDGVAITNRNIDVTDMEVFLKQCSDVFDQTIYEAAKKKGVEINDLEGTEIEAIAIKLIEDAMTRDLIRQSWFNDTSLTGNADYNAYDGWFKLIAAGIAATTITNLPIASMSTGQNAHDAIEAVYNAQSLAMKSQATESKVILVTRNIYDKYVDYLRGLGADATFNSTINGVGMAKFSGIEVIPMDIWTEYFTADFSSDLGNGRIVMVVKDEALMLGVDAESDYTVVQSWYSIDDDIQKFRVRYKVGPTLKYHEMIVVAGFPSGSSS